MKVILQSLHPEQVARILNGEQTAILSKTVPKCELPIDVYIYCTKGAELWGDGSGTTWNGIASDEDMETVTALNPTLARLNTKIVAKYTLNAIEDREIDEFDLFTVCLSIDEALKYSKDAKKIYLRHISDLVVFDKPMELSEFYSCRPCRLQRYGVEMTKRSHINAGNCGQCKFYNYKTDDCDYINVPLSRVPQSWQFVEVEE